MKLEEIKNNTQDATDCLVQSLEAGHRVHSQFERSEPKGNLDGFLARLVNFGAKRRQDRP
jgi:hypothetical protein